MLLSLGLCINGPSYICRNALVAFLEIYHYVFIGIGFVSHGKARRTFLTVSQSGIPQLAIFNQIILRYSGVNAIIYGKCLQI